MAEFDAGVGDHLDQPFKVEFGRNRDAGAVEQFQSARFLADLHDPRLQRFVHGKKARFERLALGDVEERAAQRRTAGRRPCGPFRRASAAARRDAGL